MKLARKLSVALSLLAVTGLISSFLLYAGAAPDSVSSFDVRWHVLPFKAKAASIGQPALFYVVFACALFCLLEALARKRRAGESAENLAACRSFIVSALAANALFLYLFLINLGRHNPWVYTIAESAAMYKLPDGAALLEAENIAGNYLTVGFFTLAAVAAGIQFLSATVCYRLFARAERRSETGKISLFAILPQAIILPLAVAGAAFVLYLWAGGTGFFPEKSLSHFTITDEVERKTLENYHELSMRENRGDRPPVIIVFLDALRRDAVGVYGAGKSRTPNLDALAAAGVRFSDPVSQGPETRITHLSVMSGRFNPPGNSDTATPPRLSLPTVLKQFGYKTALFSRGYFKTASYGLVSKGAFDTYGTSNDEVKYEYFRKNRGEPFLAYVDILEPHRPYRGGGKDSADDKKDSIVSLLEGTPSPRLEYMLRFNLLRLTPGEIGKGREMYMNNVELADLRVGLLLKKTLPINFRVPPIIIVTADHGEAMGEHGYYFGHSMYLYEEFLKTPFIVYAPGIIRKPGAVINATFQSADIYPTVLGLLDIPAAGHLEGEDMSARVIAGRGGHKKPYTLHHSDHIGQRRWAIRKLPYKYILSNWWGFRLFGNTRLQLAGEELYNIESDPGEKKNLASTHPETAAALRRVVENYFFGGGYSQDAFNKDAKSFDPKLKRQLKSLGYFH